MKFIKLIFIIITFVLCRAEADEAAVKTYLNNVANQVIHVVDKSDKPNRWKTEKLMDILEDNFDITWMSKFALASNFRNLDNDLRNQYTKQYKKYLLYSYLPKLMLYSNETFKILHVTKTGKANYVVDTKVIRKDGKPPIRINYQVKDDKDNSGNYKVVDIVVEGVSAILSERSEFSSIVQNSGVAGLIKLLAEKNVQFDKQYA